MREDGGVGLLYGSSWQKRCEKFGWACFGWAKEKWNDQVCFCAEYTVKFSPILMQPISNYQKFLYFFRAVYPVVKNREYETFSSLSNPSSR